MAEIDRKTGMVLKKKDTEKIVRACRAAKKAEREQGNG